MMSHAIAVIPARGQSKRIPRKNMRMFFGHPLLAYAIAAAKNTGVFREVIVSSEDEEIGEAAQYYGAIWVKRPAHLAEDGVPTADVVIHALQELDSAMQQISSVCVLHPTNPLRTAADILKHAKAFETGERAFQVAVVPYRAISPHWTMAINEFGQGVMVNPDAFATSSERLPLFYCPSGAIYWAKVSALLEHKTLYGPSFYAEPMNANHGVDIDTEEDWALAELLVHGLWARDHQSPLEPVGISPLPMQRHERLLKSIFQINIARERVIHKCA